MIADVQLCLDTSLGDQYWDFVQFSLEKLVFHRLNKLNAEAGEIFDIFICVQLMVIQKDMPSL